MSSRHSVLWLPVVILFLLFTQQGWSQYSIAPCRGDNRTDDTACIQQTLNWIQSKGGTEATLLPGTFLLSAPLVVPTKMHLGGSGRGDTGLLGTTIMASPSFPAGSPLVIMGGTSGGPYFAVQVTDMTLDCHGRASIGLQNTQSEEQSYGKHLLMLSCPATGLDVETAGAQNSGPYEDLEIYPGTTALASTTCLRVQQATSLRAIEDVTCNAGGYSTRPNVGLAIDGASLFNNIHVEHVGTAFSLGSQANSADGMIVMNSQLGPDVNTGLTIGSNNPADQNVTIMGLRCDGCTNLLFDNTTGNTIQESSLGLYVNGNGGGGGRTIVSTQTGLQGQVSGPVIQGNTAIGPGNNQHWGATLTVWDASATGQTKVIEADSQSQGVVNLHEWWNTWGQPMAAVRSDGTFQLPAVQFSPNTPAACTQDNRGTAIMQEQDSGDHLLVCRKSTLGVYGWAQVF